MQPAVCNYTEEEKSTNQSMATEEYSEATEVRQNPCIILLYAFILKNSFRASRGIRVYILIILYVRKAGEGIFVTTNYILEQYP
jgi:hypothetical protein